MYQPNAFTEFTRKNAHEDCQIRTYRAYPTGADLEQDDSSETETAGMAKAEIHDFAIHRAGSRK